MKCPCCGTETDAVKEFAFAGDCVFWAGKPIEMYPHAIVILKALWKNRDKLVKGETLTTEKLKRNSISVYIHKIREVLRDMDIPYSIESGPTGTASYRLKKLNGRGK